MIDEPDPSEGAEIETNELPDAFSADGRRLVAGYDAQSDHEVDLESLCTIANAVLAGEGVVEGRIDLHLIDLDTITGLNVEHMDGTGPTDVLSFPLEDDPYALPNAEAPLIGDIVVCPAVAVVQAADHAGSTEAELALLVIHGVLHLLGHDHVDPGETLAMQGLERRYLAGLGHEHPVPAPPASS